MITKKPPDSTTVAIQGTSDMVIHVERSGNCLTRRTMEDIILIVILVTVVFACLYLQTHPYLIHVMHQRDMNFEKAMEQNGNSIG